MKAWQVNHFGSAEEMVFADVEKPVPGPGEVLIRNHAAGVNFFDILQIQGDYQFNAPFPFTVGAEVAGTIEVVGSDVAGFSEGDRVLAFALHGGYAEYCVAPATRVFPLAEEMSYPQAACFPIVFHTSYHALTHRGALKENEWLLVHAGASGVGMSAIQIGKVLGAKVLATAGSEAKLDFCRAQGADHVRNYRDPTWVDWVREVTGGHGADVIYDPVGGEAFELSIKCIASEGRLLVVGFASGRIPGIQANRILLKNISIVGVFWGRHCQEHPEYLGQVHKALSSLREEGKIRPVVSATYPLAEAVAALGDLAQRKISGKAALVME